MNDASAGARPGKPVGAYVINLERATERRERIAAQLDARKIPYRIFPAVDGRRLDGATMARAYDAASAVANYREMSRGEVACALSHLGVYRRMLEDGIPCALVLEDDALLGPGLEDVLAALASRFPAEEPAVVLLAHVEKYTRWGSEPLVGSVRLVRRYHEWWRAHGYFVTRGAARRMLEARYPVTSAADHWSLFERHGIVKVWAVVPYCVGLSDLAADSSLEVHRAEKDLADKSSLTLRKLVWHYGYRRFLHQLLVRPFLRVARQKRTW